MFKIIGFTIFLRLEYLSQNMVEKFERFCKVSEVFTKKVEVLNL